MTAEHGSKLMNEMGRLLDGWIKNPGTALAI
ncbi:four helix bundle protein [bacterium]|nr:four helix bundle protein [bacterium]